MFRFKTAALRFNSKHTLFRSFSDGRKVLPPELSGRTLRLTCESTAKGGICDVYVVGTRHNCPKYCEKVKAIVNYLKPQVVFLELCSNRAYFLDRDYPNKVKIEELSCRGRFLFKIAKKYGVVRAGENEFMVAYEEGIKYGATIVLGDRPIEITKKRFEENRHREMLKTSRWQLIKSFHSRPIERLLLILPKCLTKRAWNYWDVKKEDVDLMTLDLYYKHLSSLFPATADVYGDERDQYMSAMLLQVACKHNSVVAVVGLAHLAGIQKYWKQPIKVEQLLSLS